eukprot:4331615-Amphidinium_carterae.1
METTRSENERDHVAIHVIKRHKQHNKTLQQMMNKGLQSNREYHHLLGCAFPINISRMTVSSKVVKNVNIYTMFGNVFTVTVTVTVFTAFWMNLLIIIVGTVIEAKRNTFDKDREGLSMLVAVCSGKVRGAWDNVQHAVLGNLVDELQRQ